MIYQALAKISAILWWSLGLLTMGSILNSLIGLFINIIMGIVFGLIGTFFYLKGYYLKQSHLPDDDTTKFFARFLQLDLIFMSLNILFTLVLLFAGLSRVFGEGFAIFG